MEAGGDAGLPLHGVAREDAMRARAESNLFEIQCFYKNSMLLIVNMLSYFNDRKYPQVYGRY
jgi:hypothetical protein